MLRHASRALSSHAAFGGASASPAARATFEAWHRAVSDSTSGASAASELEAVLGPHVHPRCVFRPPTYYGSWTGRDETLMLLGAVSEVFHDFKYGRQWLSDDGREWALEFTAEVPVRGGGGDDDAKQRTVQGIDLVSLCEEGTIREFTVLARPPNAVSALKDAMMRKVPVRLAKLKAKQVAKKALGALGAKL